MPITGVLDLQRRSMPLGDIRIGESEEVPGKSWRRPKRRDTFLFTTEVEETAVAIAGKFGGTVEPWPRRRGYWQVDTPLSVIEVWVPPRGRAVESWMRLWNDGAKRQCDGITEILSGRPCMCPQPEDRTDPYLVAAAAAERKRLAAENPPRACKPRTWINVAIPGLPGVNGVWVLRTGSANAAVETADSGDVLERARGMDVYLPALLVIQWRTGQNGKPYPVPALRLRPSAEQLAQLPTGMDGMVAQLQSGGRLALTSGAPAETPAEAPGEAPEAHAPGDRVAKIAAQIAAGIPLARSREDVAKLIERAKKESGALEATVWTTPEGEDAEVGETLREMLDARWHELPAPARSTTAPRQRRDGPEEAHAARPPAPPVTSPAGGADSLFDEGDETWMEGR